MRILIYGINYYPELTGIGKYTGDMGAWLAGEGHSVEVITALPYYPEWAVHASHAGRGWVTEQIEGAVVQRSPLYVPKNVTSVKRILHEFSFVAGSLPYWLRALVGKRPDVVICVAPAFHLGFVALAFARLRRVPMVYHIQDLQVDMAKELGMLKNQTFLNILIKAERFILDRCTRISTISEGMIGKLVQKGLPKARCLLFPNWVDGTAIRPLPPGESLRASFGLSETDRVVLYSGSLGEKQGLDMILTVANQLRHRTDLYFLIVGSGGAEPKLVEMARQLQLTQVKFFPLQPYEKLAALLATADIHLVLQRKSASDLVLPSKLTSILAAGGFSLITAVSGTSLYSLVETHRIGLAIEPESADALQAGIEQALHMDLTPYRQNARQYAEQHLDKDRILQRFVADLQTLLPS
ncbi:MAG: colanic acid biosynthesis glycosyltransferase WcaI [Cytophagales bacterium]|nr:MAG: colanic acid biosynthesis glycosyltransferase WcaI [Cytophagales bacterium]